MIVVFGAKGFIGSYLIDRLKQDGVEYFATDKDHVDITKSGEFNKLPEKVDVVVHLACLQPANVSDKEYDPVKYIETNVIGTLNVLEYCRKTKARLIYFNSHKKPKGEYGMYAISENTATESVMYYHIQYGMRYLIFKLPPVYGYGCYTEIFKDGKPVKTGFKTFIDNAVESKPLVVWGDCKKGRDIIYVKDVVSAILLALKNDKINGSYNLGLGKPITLEEEAREIVSVFSPKDKPSEMVYCPHKANGIEPLVMKICKTKKDLNWTPQYFFRDMLLDYKKEWESEKFDFLVEKRKRMVLEYEGK
jgi:UDP-glucose 4-epimerase